MKKFIKKIIKRAGYTIQANVYNDDYTSWLIKYNIGTIIDIGANIGQFAKMIRKDLPTAKLYSFEPISSCFNELRLQQLHDKNFEAFNFALGNSDGKVEINVSNFSPSSSLLQREKILSEAFPYTIASNSEQILIKKLDDIIPTLDAPKNWLVKIDTQGYEDKVIEGGLNTLNEATMIWIETCFVPLYQNQPLFDDIYKALTKIGFDYFGNLNRKKNRLSHFPPYLYEDSIFIKNNF